MPSTRQDSGFTLVELMVVVLIIGILVAIAVPVFNVSLVESHKRSCFANERTVEGAYVSYVAFIGPTAPAFDDEGTLMAAIVPDFISAPPRCPSGGTYSWERSGTLNCSYEGHFHY
jgi:general secretion pathway protein G